MLDNVWLTISALLFNVKYGSSVFTNTFTASFWSGYTQEVNFSLLPWNRSDGFVA